MNGALVRFQDIIPGFVDPGREIRKCMAFAADREWKSLK